MKNAALSPCQCEVLEQRSLFAASSAILAYVGADADYRPAVYEMMDDNSWNVVTLEDVPGSPRGVFDAVAWIDPDNGRTFAAAASEEGVVLYTRTSDGLWGQRNLTEAIPGSEPILDELHYMVDATGAFFLIGFTETGDAVRYALGNDSDRWTYRNITEVDLEPSGADIPYIVSEIAPYATGWNGLNAAGIDEDGQVWSVWWAPGLANWAASNLSEVTGTRARFVGDLTVYTTPWNGINIAGVGEDGHLRVVWWVPEFNSHWEESDLTDLVGGPKLDPYTLTSYTTDWGGLNIAGFDTDSGRLVQYWWAPDQVQWQVSDMTALVGDPWDVVDLRGVSATDRSLNLVTTVANDSGDLSVQRSFWQPGMAGWQTIDVSGVAVSLSDRFGLNDDHVYNYGYGYASSYGSTVSGSSDQEVLDRIYAYYQSLRNAFGQGIANGSAFWYDTGYETVYQSGQGEWFTDENGWYYDPDYWADDGAGSAGSPNTVDFNNYQSYTIPGAQSPNVGVLTQQFWMADNGIGNY